MRSRVSLTALLLAAGAYATTTAWADSFFFTTGNTDGKLGALSRSDSIETETADDFILDQTTVISGATMTGLVLRTDVADIANVEVEVYHRLTEDPFDKVPPSGNVPSRTNSPSDNEIDTATRDASDGTLSFSYSSLNSNFSVKNTVVNGINPFKLTVIGPKLAAFNGRPSDTAVAEMTLGPALAAESRIKVLPKVYSLLLPAILLPSTKPRPFSVTDATPVL